MKKIIRCAWVTEDPLYLAYHDQEWGVPVYDDRLLFEFLILEGMQAGLSWLTILKRREHFRAAFDQFDPEKISKYGQEKMEILLQDSGIIRNRLKIEAAILNANAFLEIQKTEGCFSEYMWRFVGGKPRENTRAMDNSTATTSEIAERMSHDLKKRGFKFVGGTICYAFMQAVGMVNDHATDCFLATKNLSE